MKDDQSLSAFKVCDGCAMPEDVPHGDGCPNGHRHPLFLEPLVMPPYRASTTRNLLAAIRETLGRIA